MGTIPALWSHKSVGDLSKSFPVVQYEYFLYEKRNQTHGLNGSIWLNEFFGFSRKTVGQNQIPKGKRVVTELTLRY